ncbi:hypothetical protein L873DRAFT_1731451 [Choiromyces venosus 120613-1]|uniref:5'-3' DNA helicase ZGRF1-like N-terminal domain-containing protein n=1 Tax=Choiromyces venosus 120613-1 TaxID=1336337 RepID=A0A3N4KC99_9PEZI|nr:hypothetical protein L873DRAFT_1731451 [Choiromyces venosus 120613-1]
MADQTKTAPVDEYRVMWTANKTQKIKKWHDGFLRYHSFNRRMLVYDDGRHLVADMYLRDREFLGEGDELEFEHHLVSIEDFSGSVNQDLTPIFSPALQRKQAAATVASAAQTPVPNRRRDPAGAPRGGIPGAQSARQQRPATRGSYTPTSVQGENRNGPRNGHMTTPTRPAQAPATVPRMNVQGNRNEATNLNTPGRQDHPPVAGSGRNGQVNEHVGMNTPGPQARAPIPAFRGNGQASGNTNINTPVRNPSSHNPYPTRQNAVYPPQANERPIIFRPTESPIPRQAPPSAPRQPATSHQNHNIRPVGRSPPPPPLPVTKGVAHANAQLASRRPPPPQRPQHQERNIVPETGRPVTAGRQIPAQVNRLGNVTGVSPPMPQVHPVSRAGQSHYPIPQQIQPPVQVQQRHSPPTPQPRSRAPPPPTPTPRAPSPPPAPPPPAPAQAPQPEEPLFKAPATLSKIRQFSFPSRARPPRQPTAPQPVQNPPEFIQVPSSAAAEPTPPPPQRTNPPPNLQKQTSIPNSRSPSPTGRPQKRPSTSANDESQPPSKRKSHFQSARALVNAQKEAADEIRDVEDSDDDDDGGKRSRQGAGAGVIKLSSTAAPKKRGMLLCARPPTFRFPPRKADDEPPPVSKSRVGEDEEWDEDDEIMRLY